MINVIGALIGIGTRLGLIGKRANITKLILIGTIVSIFVASFFVSMMSGTATIVENATTVYIFMLYVLGGVVVGELGIYIANKAKKVF